MKIYLILLFAFASVGCNSQITDYVKGAAKPLPVPIAASSNSPYALKISPGAVQSKGVAYSGAANITTTDRTLTGTQIQAKVSISQSRKNLK